MLMKRLLRGLLVRALAMLDGSRGASDGQEELIVRLRSWGVTIGENCRIYTTDFSTEPYLVTLGDRVGISGGTKFLTHDGSVWLLRGKRPEVQTFGTIRVGDDVYIGENCLILPGTEIGARSIIGAGSVVRGRIPENSLVTGNPAKIVGRASLFLEMLRENGNTMDTLALDYPTRRALLRRHFGLPE